MEEEKAKVRIYLAQALGVSHLSGTTVQVEKTKGRIYLAQVHKGVTSFRYRCRGEEDKGQD